MKTILITGSTDGIGKAAARYYAENGYEVIVHGKNNERVQSVLSELKDYNVDSFVADFNSLSEVIKSTEILKAKYKSIDVLVNNAAIIAKEYRETVDGYESTFQINHLSPFLFTLGVLPLIKASNHSQIINISSVAHAETVDFDRILDKKYFDSYSAYEISKLANILFTYYLSDLLLKDNVYVNTLHPGVIRTKLLHVLWSGGESTEEAVNMINNVEYLVEKERVTGKYYIYGHEGETSDISYEKEVQSQMWQFCLKLIKDKKNVNFFNNL